MSDELREELEGLAEAWEDDAALARESTGGGPNDVAATYDECADEIRALLARHAAAAGGPGGG